MGADGGIRDKSDALLSHEIDAPPDDSLIELHVGNAVHEQTTNAIGALVHGHPVPSTVQLRRASEPRGAGTNHSYLFSGTFFRRLRFDPALRKTVVDNRPL